MFFVGKRAYYSDVISFFFILRYLLGGREGREERGMRGQWERKVATVFVKLVIDL